VNPGPKSVLKHSQSKRWRVSAIASNLAKRLECGRFSAALKRFIGSKRKISSRQNLSLTANKTRPFVMSLPVFALMAMFCFFGICVTRAQTAGGLSDAQIQGRKLAVDLCNSRPAEDLTNTGVLQIRHSDGGRIEIPIQCEIFVTSSNWQAVYRIRMTNATNRAASPGREYFSDVRIVHVDGQPNRYIVPNVNPPPDDTNRFFHLTGAQLLTPFATSDFWLCDLGLQFFHWPEQKVLPKTTNLKRGRSYTLLESTNPNPSPDGYSRVVSWIDRETGGILEAEAYDAQGKLLKVFEPKSFKKVNGQWELQQMEIRNVQTDSRTRIEFDLQKD